ncbi:hypothetical protein BASA81_006182 [Batrachochytrium salamandrivorans]|nr:hypothetical protein BASA81_006182 [Batrachochytrium salamandrivorans]
MFRIAAVRLRAPLAAQSRSFVRSTALFSTTPTSPPSSTKHEFKTETGKILDIVSNSLYSERDVFLRELISNASDALEKFRFFSVSSETTEARELQIEIQVDSASKTLTITDSGMGMTREEMLQNLGTIGKSGSADFAKQNVGDSSNIIGRFGVGFYSAFMVGNRVEVRSRSSKATTEEDNGHVWTSEGAENFTLDASPSPLPFGTSIVIQLRDDEFASVDKVKQTISRYSSFVSFPVLVNGVSVNNVAPLWCEEPNKVTKERHQDFYKFTYGGGFDPEPPLYTLHFRTEAPIDMKALFYIPKHNPESAGMARVQPGVSLYTRKVLLEKESQLLPNWARFVKGVVDSEDLPLSISRETAQDRRMVQKMGQTVTKKLLRFLRDCASKDPETFATFAVQFGSYIKEGIVSDFASQADLVKLVRFDTSVLGDKDKTKASLDDVVGRMPAHQKKLYYLSATSRKMAESSPYFELFKKNKIEVIFLYKTIDEFVMSNLGTYEGRELVSLESNNIEPGLFKESGELQQTANTRALCSWMKQLLGIHSVSITNRLEGFPAIVVDHESAALRRMMKVVDQQEGFDFAAMEEAQKLNKRKLEINPGHALVKDLDVLRRTTGKQDLATKLAHVIYDGALLQADLVDDPRESLRRSNAVLEELLAQTLPTADLPVEQDETK